MPKGVFERSLADKVRLTKQILNCKHGYKPRLGKNIKCNNCGKIKYVTKSQLDMGKGKFCTRSCSNKYRIGIPHTDEWKKQNSERMKGDKHPMWNGGKYLHAGYVMILKPKHPNATNDGYVREHRLVMEKKLGRFLERREVVHHIDHDKTNNKISNLMLFSSQVEHKRYEQQEKRK